MHCGGFAEERGMSASWAQLTPRNVSMLRRPPNFAHAWKPIGPRRADGLRWMTGCLLQIGIRYPASYYRTLVISPSVGGRCVNPMAVTNALYAVPFCERNRRSQSSKFAHDLSVAEAK